jgi:hypothetical protein
MNKQLINGILEDLKYYEKYKKHKVIANRIKLKLNALRFEETSGLTTEQKYKHYEKQFRKYKQQDKYERLERLRELYKKFLPFIQSDSMNIKTDRRSLIAVYLRSLNYTLREIGIVMGKDHSTISYYLDRDIKDLSFKQTEIEFKNYLREIL